MEIQGLSLLQDLKVSVKKRLFRHVVIQVQRKIQRDITLLSNHHVVEILMKQIEAIHGLFNQVIVGKFQKKPQKIQKLLKIVNRNVKICIAIFQQHINNHMIHLGKQRTNSCIQQIQLPQVKKTINQFFMIIVRNCYYLYLLAATSGANCSFAQQFQLTKNLKQILGNFSQPKKLKNQMILIEIYLLLMAIRLQQPKISFSQHEFYQAINGSLQCLKIIDNKFNSTLNESTSKMKNLYSRKDCNQKQRQNMFEKKEIYILIMVAIINNQRMLVQTGKFHAWEIGFALLKKIEKEFRLQQSNWGKYIRIQHENNMIIQKQKENQIKNIFVPYLTDSLYCISQLIKAQKMLVITSFPSTYSNSQNSQTMRKDVHRKTYYFSKLVKKQFSDQNEDRQSKYFITYNRINEKSSEANKQSNNCNFKTRLDIKKSPKKLIKNSSLKINKFTPIDLSSVSCLSNSNSSTHLNLILNDSFNESICLANSKNITERNSKLSKNAMIMKNQAKSTSQNKKIKKKILNKNAFDGTFTGSDFDSGTYLNSFSVELNSFKDQMIKDSKKIIQNRKKSFVFHRLLNEEGKQNIDQIALGNTMIRQADNSKNNQKQVQLNSKRKSFQTGIAEVLIKLIILNKGKLRLKLLIDKYQVAKKRKKIRNYQMEMIQFQLNKNIANMVMSYRKKRSMPERRQNLQIAKKSQIAISQPQQKQKEQQNQQDNKIFQTTHKKSKQAIKQMLKKITANSMKFNKKNEKFKYFNDFHLSFQSFN